MVGQLIVGVNPMENPGIAAEVGTAAPVPREPRFMRASANTVSDVQRNCANSVVVIGTIGGSAEIVHLYRSV
jgi:hypothetical protein